MRHLTNRMLEMIESIETKQDNGVVGDKCANVADEHAIGFSTWLFRTWWKVIDDTNCRNIDSGETETIRNLLTQYNNKPPYKD